MGFLKRNNFISFLAIIISVIIITWQAFDVAKWKNNQVINNDVVGYYGYLPAVFIYHDIKIDFANNLPEGSKGRVWFIETPNGDRVFKYTMGMSIMYSPFFLIAHQYAKTFDYLTDGYSEPYGMFLVISGLFYTFFGLFFTRKILLQFFNDEITTYCLLSILFCTNLYYYAIYESAMSHPANFFLISCFIWETIQWHKNPDKLKNTVIIGVILSLITLVRPTNILIALFFIFYDVTSFKSIKKKLIFFLNHWKKLLIIFSVLACSIFFQLLYWKTVTGNWFFYAYQDEHFNFAAPNIINGLFSYRKGWLVYSPLMLFALIGLFFLFKKNKKLFVSISFFMIVFIYVTYSWWCWWYGGSFGSRPMIDILGLVAIPLGYFYYYLTKNNFLKIIPVILISIFSFLNIYQTNQYRFNIMHWESMTKEAYWSIFLKEKAPENFDSLLKHPDIEKAKKGIKEY